jgi:predicted component of type VI protein secretion system
MEQSQNKHRHSAAKEFLQSLDQLEGILQENTTEDEAVETSQLHTDSANDAQLVENLTEIDLEAFEDAVADIEQYFEEKKK